MSVLVEFLLNNYIWVLIISLILVFALIGYLVDITTPKKVKKKKVVEPIVEYKEEEKFKVHPSVQAYTNEQFDDPLIK